MQASEAGGLGQKSHSNDRDKDKAQAFSGHKNAFDAVFFSGSNERDEYFVVATERRPDMRINGVFYLAVTYCTLFFRHGVTVR